MKILHCVEQYPPDTGGMAEVVRRLSEGLVHLGHEVTVLTTSRTGVIQEEVQNGVCILRFPLRGNLAHGIQGNAEAYVNWVKENPTDILTIFAAQQWSADLLLPHLESLPGRKVFVPTGFSGLFQKSYRKYYRNMRHWLLQFDKVIYLSRNYRDYNFASELGLQNGVVIPNGAAHEEFGTPMTCDIRNELGIPAHHRLLLLVGSHTGLKGHDEAMEIFQRSAMDNATLLIVGNHLPLRWQPIRELIWKPIVRSGMGGHCPFSCRHGVENRNSLMHHAGFSKRILMRTLPRALTIAAYQQADLFLFPSNIECSPIVLFECMAARTPFLTTDVGNSKEIIEMTGAGRLLPTFVDNKGYSHADILGSIAILDSLICDAEALNAMAEQGYQAWRTRFTWEKIAESYLNVYSTVLGDGKDDHY